MEAPEVVFVRRGVLERAVDGRTMLVDAASCYITRPGSAERFAHPHGPDLSTAISVDPAHLGQWGDPGLSFPVHALPASPIASFQAQDLLRRAESGASDKEMVEGVLILVGDVPAGCLSPAPTVSMHRRHLADEVRTLLSEVAVDAGFSDQAHLTRSMREEYGHTPGRLRAYLYGKQRARL